MIAGFIAVLFLGRLGQIQLAAGILAISTYTVVLIFSASVFQGLSITMRKTAHRVDKATLTTYFANSVFLAIALASIFAILLWHADILLRFSGQEKDLVYIVQGYFHWMALAIFPSLLVTVMNQFSVGLGFASPLLYIEILTFLPRVILYYLLIQGGWYLPEMGLSGIAFTEFFIKSMIFLVLSFRVLKADFYKPYCAHFISAFSTFDYGVIKKIAALGFPIALQSSGEIAAMSVAAYMMGLFGATALAVLSITNQYMIVVMMFAYGLSQALTLLVSESLNNPHSKNTINGYLSASTMVMVIYALPFIILFFNCSQLLLGLFLPADFQNMEIQQLARYFFIISACFILIEGFRNIVIGALWGVLDSYKRMLGNLGVIWLVALPLSYLFAFSLKGGPVGLRIGFLMGLMVSLFVLGAWLVRVCHQSVFRSESTAN